MTFYRVVDSTGCQPDRLFSFHYPAVQSIRSSHEQKNKESFSVSSVKKKKNDVSHSLLRKALGFDSPSSLRKLRGLRSHCFTLLNNLQFSRYHRSEFFFIFFVLRIMTLVILFLFTALRFLKLISSPVAHSIHYVFEQLKSSSTHYVPDSLVLTVSSVIH